MATIGELNAVLTADVSDFVAPIANATNELTKLSSTVSEVAQAAGAISESLTGVSTATANAAAATTRHAAAMDAYLDAQIRAEGGLDDMTTVLGRNAAETETAVSANFQLSQSEIQSAEAADLEAVALQRSAAAAAAAVPEMEAVTMASVRGERAIGRVGMASMMLASGARAGVFELRSLSFGLFMLVPSLAPLIVGATLTGFAFELLGQKAKKAAEDAKKAADEAKKAFDQLLTSMTVTTSTSDKAKVAYLAELQQTLRSRLENLPHDMRPATVAQRATLEDELRRTTVALNESRAALKPFKDDTAEAAKYLSQATTPLEVFRGEIADLTRLLNEHEITGVTYWRSLQKAAEDYNEGFSVYVRMLHEGLITQAQFNQALKDESTILSHGAPITPYNVQARRTAALAGSQAEAAHLQDTLPYVATHRIGVGGPPGEVGAPKGIGGTAEANIEASLGPAFAELQKQMQLTADISDRMHESIVGGITTMFAQIGDAIAHGGNIFKGLGALLEETLGNLMVSVGQSMIAFGVASTAIATVITNPLGAIAAGGALVALGTALAASAQASVSAATGGGGGGMSAPKFAAPTGFTSSLYGSNGLFQGGQGSVTVIFPSGPQLYDPNDPNQVDDFRRMFEAISSRNVIVQRRA